jgi:hypothetical protein
MLDLNEIAAALRADERVSGNVQLLHRSSAFSMQTKPPADVANCLVREWGFQEIDPRSWTQLDRLAAVDVARRLLAKDLAYKTELLSEETATYYADQLMAVLSPYKAQFVCNTEFHGTSTFWDPIGVSTFEVALVGFDDTEYFLLYAQAED